MSSSGLVALIEKTDHYDKDERYMATSDICAELSKDIRIDEVMERRICTVVLKQLDDQCNNVQSVAVRCLGILVRKVHENQIGEICDKLCALILEGTPALRDIYSMGLKTLISDVPEEMGNLVASHLTVRLLRGVSTTQNDDIKKECVDRLGDLLRRFGHLFVRDHDDIMNAVLRLLESTKAPVRRRAAACLGVLAVVSSDILLSRLVETILTQINVLKANDRNTLIQTIGNISRTVGFRLGRYLDRLVPVFLQFCGDPEDESQQTEAANDLRESCFPGLESFVSRCPREIAPHLDRIVDTACRFVSYDPNYSYDDETEAMDTEDGAADEDFEDDDDGGGGSEDDDGSWKVRKAAVKVLSATLSSPPEGLSPSLYTKLFRCLLGRFKEREEGVRLDVLHCFSNLLCVHMTTTNHATTTVATVGGDGNPAAAVSAGATELLRGRVGEVLAALKPHLGGAASTKTKTAAFALLRTLVTVLKGGLEEHLSLLFSIVQKSLQDKTQSQTLRLEALWLLRLLLDMHPPVVVQGYVPSLLPLVLSAVRDDWVKMTVEALRVTATVIAVIRPVDTSTDTFVTTSASFDPTVFVIPLYEAVLSRLQVLDIDQEVKEGAVHTAGRLLYHLGDRLAAEVPVVLSLLLRRLGTDVTRMAALRALGTVAASPVRVDMSCVLTQVISDLAGFLKQQSRALKQAALQALDAIVSGNAEQLSVQLVSDVLREAAPLVAESDLHLAALTLRLALTLMDSVPGAAEPVCVELMPRSISLSSSALLQGMAHANLIQLLQKVVLSKVSGYSFSELFAATIDREDASLPRQSVVNLSKCIAGVCVRLSPAEQEDVVQRFAEYIRDGSGSARQHLALQCIGELGQQIDLARETNLKDLIQSCFESSQEEIKTSAAFALGHLAVGNLTEFLPVVIQGVGSHRHPYLYLQALREIITVHASTGRDLTVAFDAVLPILLANCRAAEEGVRCLVAECMGALLCQDLRLVPVFESMLEDAADKTARWTVAAALRYSLSHHHHPAGLSGHGPFENLLRVLLDDTDTEVRRAALLMVNAAVHYNVSTVRDLLVPLVLPHLHSALRFRSERVVDLGPFKHKVDDGLPLRKAALTCVETALDTVPLLLISGGGATELLQHMSSLLDDKPEMRLQAYQVLAKLCVIAPDAIVAYLDQLIDPIEKSIKRKAATADSGGAGTGVGAAGGTGDPAATDRSLELTRTALRTVLVINELEVVSSNRRWSEFLDRIRRDDRNAAVMDMLRLDKVADNI